MVTDCHNHPLPVYAKGKVLSIEEVKGAVPAGSVKLLKITVEKGNPVPAAGQFYMLKAVRSNFLLARPVSVFHSQKNGDGSVEIHFMILVKGGGTVELTGLPFGEEVNLLGPCGNGFGEFLPEGFCGKDGAAGSFEKAAERSGKSAGGAAAAAGSKGNGGTKAPLIAIVGGGIGVAPVAGFAETLADGSYDFFASFKSGSYGLKNIKASTLTITTDDGSEGVHGMLSAAFTEDLLNQKKYAAVYACGPTPMLAYIQQVCAKTNTKCYLSMEAHMACGVGVCLGCVIPTTLGKLRCCKDGPVFDGSILIFEKKDNVAGIKIQPRRAPLADGVEPDLSTEIAGVRFENPLIGSSGAFGFGTEYASVFDVNRLGGIASKGLTLEPRQGNEGQRLVETPAGLMNSIGLQNPGIPHFIEHELPQMLALKPVSIANLSGSTLETYVEGAKLLDKTEVPMIELNISCPNVKAGGAAFGMTCSAAGEVVRAVRAATKKPLIVKLTPQAPDLKSVALECIAAGAQGISLCNSFQGIAVDIERGVPVFENLKAGVGGPAVRPIAVRLVYELVQAINTLPEAQRVPVVAIGGIATWQDAVEFIMAGASALEVGTATFVNPFAMIEIIDGLKAFMKRKGYGKLSEMRGMIQKA